MLVLILIFKVIHLLTILTFTSIRQTTYGHARVFCSAPSTLTHNKKLWFFRRFKIYFLQKPLSKVICLSPIVPVDRARSLQWRSQKVLLHNASNKELGFMQYLPTLIPVSRSRQVELPAVGGGGSESSEVMPRNPKGRIHEGYATPWPRDEHGHYKHDRLPYPEYLDTLRRGWGACLVVFDEVAGADARFLRRIDCDAGTVIILLDEIHQRKIVKQSVIDEVEKQMMAGT